MHIVKQAKAQEGFIQLKNTGFGYMHYTLTVWENEDDMRAFARAGAHLASLRKSNGLATEIRTYSYSGENIPSWSEAKKILAEKGKVFTFK
jgi:hypothetical protein